MPTVPRPERTPKPSEADGLRELLAAIADVLDVPMGDNPDAALALARDRSIIVKHVARAASSPGGMADPAAWLRSDVAAFAPAPEAAPGE